MDIPNDILLFPRSRGRGEGVLKKAVSDHRYKCDVTGRHSTDHHGGRKATSKNCDNLCDLRLSIPFFLEIKDCLITNRVSSFGLSFAGKTL